MDPVDLRTPDGKTPGEEDHDKMHMLVLAIFWAVAVVLGILAAARWLL